MDDPGLTPESDLTLTVIVPARNEEESLPGCLASLLAQSEPGFTLGRQWELLIIDDRSTDRTRAIADQAAGQHGVSVLSAPEFDLSRHNRGFTGKTNACWAGAQQARGRWLLFTDADTLHEPGDLSRSLYEAEKYKVSLLSYSPRQRVRGLLQSVVMPLVFAELAEVYPMAQVNDPASRMAAANGQYLLVASEAYFAVGGHRAVGPSVLEDVDLARNIKRSDRGIRFRYAPDAVSTQMYRDTASMKEGWRKNLALLFPAPLLLAAFRLLELILLIGLPLLAAAIPYLAGWQRTAILLVWLRTLWRFYGRVAKSHFSAGKVALSVCGLPLLIVLLIESYVDVRVKKAVTWKGRSYLT